MQWCRLEKEEREVDAEGGSSRWMSTASTKMETREQHQDAFWCSIPCTKMHIGEGKSSRWMRTASNKMKRAPRFKMHQQQNAPAPRCTSSKMQQRDALRWRAPRCIVSICKTWYLRCQLGQAETLMDFFSSFCFCQMTL